MKLLTSLLLTLAAAVALHRYSPDNWPVLAINLMHALHGIGFAILAIGVLLLLKPDFPANNKYWLAGAISIAIALLSEGAQIPGPRDAQLSDLIVDGLGIGGALGVVALFDASVRQQLSRFSTSVLALVASVSLTLACLPFFWASYALVQQYRAFPEILSFERAWEQAAFGQTPQMRPTVQNTPHDWPASGRKLALAEANGQWGILISVFPQPDWSDYSKLTFVAASTGGALELGIALRDMANHNEDTATRFYKTLLVGTEPQRYVISFDEVRSNATTARFDFSSVESIVLSAHRPGQEAQVMLDDFRLEP